MTIANSIAGARVSQRVLKIDLAEVWWSTRLYLAAALSERLTQVRWLLVVDSSRHSEEERLVGMVPTSAVLALVGRMHEQTARFERMASRLKLPDDAALAARSLLDMAWEPAFRQSHVDAHTAESQAQKTASAELLQRWFGGSLLSSAVPIADLNRASVIDLLLLVSYPCELVPVATSPEPSPGQGRRTVIDVVDKSSLNKRLALSYLQELMERARIV